MASCSVQDLLSASSCFACLPAGQLAIIEVTLLCKQLQAINPVANCSPAELLRDGSCFACLSPGELAIIRTQLQCEILNAGGGSGNSCLLCGVIDPVAVPSCACAIYFRTDTGTFFYWNTITWKPILV